MGAKFQQLTIFQKQNPVGHPDGGKAVRNQHGHLAFNQSAEPLENLVFGAGVEGDFIRSLPYPDSELIVNVASVNEAITRQGSNDLDTRVWWDKK